MELKSLTHYQVLENSSSFGNSIRLKHKKAMESKNKFNNELKTIAKYGFFIGVIIGCIVLANIL